jgi:hypothetical protein
MIELTAADGFAAGARRAALRYDPAKRTLRGPERRR